MKLHILKASVGIRLGPLDPRFELGSSRMPTLIELILGIWVENI